MQVPHPHALVQVWVPLHRLTLQARLVPEQQVHPSSQRPSQSSSPPLHVSEGGVQLPQAHEAEQVRVPVLPQVVVQLPGWPAQHVQPLSHVPSQSSSTPLHVSAGGTQLPQAQEPEQVRVPVLPQVVVQLPDWPAQHAKVSSHRLSQSSSAPLQVSAGGTQLPQAQEPEQVRVPVVPQVVAQLVLVPEQHVQPSSQSPSQSSSMPLHVSDGVLQLPQLHDPEQRRVPDDPQLVVQLPDCPAQHVKPSSHSPSQSSSAPLHVSEGGLQALQLQLPVQVREPRDPHVVVQLDVAPAQQLKLSSQSPSQSSSSPLQVSDGGVQLPQAQEAEQIRVPDDPQLVVQLAVSPRQHPKPSSHIPSQSSSTPLHISDGGVQLPQVHEDVQVREPTDPQVVVQLPEAPAQHVKPSSQVPSQSSSWPLHVSDGGLQLPQAQAEEQVRVPVVPQAVVQLPVAARQQLYPLSHVPSQSSS